MNRGDVRTRVRVRTADMKNGNDSIFVYTDWCFPLSESEFYVKFRGFRILVATFCLLREGLRRLGQDCPRQPVDEQGIGPILEKKPASDYNLQRDITTGESAMATGISGDRPSVFVGSSSEGLDFAHAVGATLEKDAEVTV